MKYRIIATDTGQIYSEITLFKYFNFMAFDVKAVKSFWLKFFCNSGRSSSNTALISSSKSETSFLVEADSALSFISKTYNYDLG